MAGSCAHGDDLSSSIKDKALFDKLNVVLALQEAFSI